jgi:hypothetical protein
VDILLPGLATGLCVALAWSMLKRFMARRRLHELIWGVTFAVFGVAAGAETYGSAFGWNPALVRLYYLSGASLTVGFLALGTMVLLVPRRIALVVLGVVLVQSVFMVFLVLRSPVDPETVQAAGWSALGKDGNLRALALTINVLGTLVVIVGTFGSAYSQWVAGNGARATGVFLIGLGTLTVAAGASLTRFGHYMLYGPMVVGLLLIFAGYRRATNPGGPTSVSSVNRLSEIAPEGEPADGTIRGEEARREPWQSHSKS